MVKTETEIERDVFRIIKASSLSSEIGGKVYRRGMRPMNSQAEDAVVTFLSGEEGQEQTGVVVLNVFIPKTLFGSGTNKVENLPRVEEIERIIVDLFTDYTDGEYWFDLRTTPQALDYDNIDQTAVYARIYYRRKIF